MIGYDIQFSLENASPYVRRDIASRYEMHRTVARVFQDAGRVLWRLDANAQTLIVRTETPVLREMYGVRGVPMPIPHIQQGDSILLRVYANPTRKLGRRVYNLSSQSDIHAWLERQLTKGGLALQRILNVEERWEACKDNTRIFGCDFIATVGVEEQEACEAMLMTGIGREKAFGYGLVMIAISSTPLRGS